MNSSLVKTGVSLTKYPTAWPSPSSIPVKKGKRVFAPQKGEKQPARLAIRSAQFPVKRFSFWRAHVEVAFYTMSEGL